MLEDQKKGVVEVVRYIGQIVHLVHIQISSNLRYSALP